MRADDDFVDISTEGGVVPDAGFFLEGDSANEVCAVGDKNVVGEGG